MAGIKYDKNKADLSLLPKSAKYGIAKAFMYGAEKYGRYNYLEGMDWSRLIAAPDRDWETNLNQLYSYHI